MNCEGGYVFEIRRGTHMKIELCFQEVSPRYYYIVKRLSKWPPETRLISWPMKKSCTRAYLYAGQPGAPQRSVSTLLECFA